MSGSGGYYLLKSEKKLISNATGEGFAALNGKC